ncbi:MAG TPA: hypothetical protein VGQ21_19075 [Thermoanaerobaculia bacterium]|jgi:hypothetical protein|nr:hypothetical protein [Thermoanaerobaculia bacterium]
MNNRRLLLVIALSIFALGATPARANFEDIVRAVESRYHVQRTTIPMFGLVRFALWCVHPGGVSDVQLATFENAHFDDMKGLTDIVRRNAGEAMQPLVQTRSNRQNETTLIYARPLGGDRVALLIFAHDREDTTVVRVVVSMDKFSEAMNHPHRIVADLR